MGFRDVHKMGVNDRVTSDDTHIAQRGRKFAVLQFDSVGVTMSEVVVREEFGGGFIHDLRLRTPQVRSYLIQGLPLQPPKSCLHIGEEEA